jgi:hypothetical protein
MMRRKNNDDYYSFARRCGFYNTALPAAGVANTSRGAGTPAAASVPAIKDSSKLTRGM